MVDNDLPKVTETLTFTSSAAHAAEHRDHRPFSDKSKKNADTPTLPAPIVLEESEPSRHQPHDPMSNEMLSQNSTPRIDNEALSLHMREDSQNHKSSQSPKAPGTCFPDGNNRNQYRILTLPEDLDTSFQSGYKKPEGFGASIGYGSNTNSVEEPITMGEEYWTRTVHDIPSPNYDSIHQLPIAMLKFLVEEIQNTPPLQIVWTILLVVGLLGGNVLQVIGLNFWLTKFPADGAPGNYTIFTVSSLIFALFFSVALGIYVIIHSPNLSFVWNVYGLKLLVLAGVFDAVSSTLSIYSASHTPEILQTLFTAFVPVYTAVLAKCFLNDARQYLNRWTILSFSLIVSGVVIASISNLWPAYTKEKSNNEQPSEGPTRDQAIWSFLFFLSVFPTVFMNITQTIYMARYTQEEVEVNIMGRLEVFGPPHDRLGDDAKPGEEAATPSVAGMVPMAVSATTPPPSSPSSLPLLLPLRGEDIAVKLVMLTVDTTVQFLFALAFMPMDALPWFGGSRSVSQTWSNFLGGLHSLVRSPGNIEFCGVYSAGFVLTYLTSSYLNQRSVTLCSMVSQLTSPTTAIVLLVFPGLNLSGEVVPWVVSGLAVLLLLVGVLVYVVWDTKTSTVRAEVGDRRLAAPLLSHANASNSTNSG
ncbi:unnamed protein product [Phytomonas sp. Hart1]|nr:unnamed protein product [Phytomonas sp. Hart1]|eukprot:CCW69728.1 unnamed protein product [Phytomonas sp. isolate Hart1]